MALNQWGDFWLLLFAELAGNSLFRDVGSYILLLLKLCYV